MTDPWSRVQWAHVEKEERGWRSWLLDEQGYVITDWQMRTSIEGLWAAGDLRQQLTRQITTAVGDATTAAVSVEKYLTELKDKD